MTRFGRRLGLLIAVFVTILAILPPPVSFAGPPQQNGGGVRMVQHDQTGAYTFIGVDTSRTNAALPRATLSGGVPAVSTALGDITAYAAEFGLSSPAQELQLMKTSGTRGGGQAFRFQQYYQGIPVVAGELIASYDPQGRLAAITGETSPNLAVPTTPNLTTAQAIDNALAYVSRQTGIPTGQLVVSVSPELWIYDARLLTHSDFMPHLVWRLEVMTYDVRPVKFLVLVNTALGGISLSFNQIDTFWGEMAAEQAGLPKDSIYQETGVPRAAPNWPNPSGATYNSNYTSDRNGSGSSTVICSTPPTALTGTGSCDGTAAPASPANAAHYFAYATFNYYDLLHGRNSIDDAGHPLISNVNFRENPAAPYANAFWDGSVMTYGDADFFTADDVVAHELSHGVTEYSSNLFYYYESGAINETFSDVFGEFADQANGIDSYGTGSDAPADMWLMGEDLGMDAIRDLSDPPAFGLPDRTQSALYWTAGTDQGGVHTNMGVGSKAAYLMAVGGTFNGYTISAIGNAKTSAIYYETNLNLLTSGADYEVFGAALVQACNNIVAGSNPLGMTAADCSEVEKATLATEMNIDPVAGTEWTVDADYCPSVSEIPGTPLFSDDFEGGLGNFVAGANYNGSSLPDTATWLMTSDVGGLGLYATSGTESVFGVNHPQLYGYAYYDVYDSFLRMNSSVAIPSSGGPYYLYFNHAFAFEAGHYDGGVLEYSTGGAGGTWNDAGSLHDDGQGYTHTIVSAYGNPLGGRSGFTQESHGYVSSRYNLTSLAGQNVMFRWRLGSDDSYNNYGWFLDDVMFYNCVSTTAPEISVEDESATDIPDGGSFNFGTTVVGSALTETFTVENTGDADLNLLTDPPTVPSGFTAGNFSSTTVAQSGTATFDVTCDATSANTYSGSVSFANNDSDENPFNFTVSCEVQATPAPEIEVEDSGATPVADGSSYDMGSGPVGGAWTETFTVTNTGTAALNLLTDPPTVPSGFTAGNFGSTALAPSVSTTFDVTCDAASTGTYSGDVSFANNDSDENPFNFTISCEVRDPAPVVINEIDYDQGATDDAEFVELYNTGGSSVDLSTLALEAVDGSGTSYLSNDLSGTLAAGDYYVICWTDGGASVDNCDSVNTGPNILSDGAPAAIALYDQSLLIDTVSYEGNTAAPYTETSGVGLVDTGAVTNQGIARYPNGTDTGVNNTDLSPRCISPGTANIAASTNCLPPEIEVTLPGPVVLADGGNVDMGSTLLGTPIVTTITVSNTGEQNLTLLTDPPTASTGFTASNFGSTTVAGGASTTFDLTCDATAEGVNGGTVTFNNNDSDENPFDFTVSCTVQGPEIEVEGPGSVAIADGGSYNMGSPVIDTPLTQTITVRNTGAAPLNLLTNPPTVPTGFTASNFGSTTLAQNASTTFDLTCDTTTITSYSGTLSFDNNDQDETPFNFTVSCNVIAPPPPDAPTLTTPSDDALLTDNTPTFEWGTVTNAVWYQIQVDDHPGFATPELDYTSAATTYTPSAPLPGSTTYYWRVRGYNIANDPGAWSTVWQFTLDPSAPDTPHLRVPRDRTYIATTTPRFIWTGVRGATQYRLQVSTDPSFSTTDIDTITTRPLYLSTTADGLDYGLYWWRVQAGDTAGNWSAWSSIFNVELTIHRSPRNADHIYTSTPRLIWARVIGATQYELEVAGDANFNNVVYTYGGLNLWTITDPLADGLYWWHMRVETPGGVSEWTPAWTLTVTPPIPTRPALVAPLPNAVLDITTPTFEWGTVPDGQVYQLQVDDRANFLAPEIDIILAPGTLTYTPTIPLPEGGRYFWRVRAINSVSAAGQWSARWVFTLNQLARPRLLDLLPGTITPDNTPEFNWEPVTDAADYEIQFDDDPRFGSPFEFGLTGGAPNYIAGPLMDGRWYWRVRAISSTGIPGLWSPAWWFMVDTTGPDAPMLRVPVEMGGTPDTTPRLIWRGARGSVLYDIQLYDASLALLLYDQTNRPVYDVPLANTLDYGMYYWQVRAMDASGNWGDWSDTSAFYVSILRTPRDGSASRNTRPAFTWYPVIGAVEYEFMLDDNNDFSSSIATYTGRARAFRVLTPLAAGDYYWQVRALDGVGTPITGWMDYWTVTITPTTPGRPRPESPRVRALINDDMPTFSWFGASNGSYYQIQIDNNSDFSSPAQSQVLPPNQLAYTATPLSDGRWYWRVRAFNTLDVAGPWSARWFFDLDTVAPDVPVLGGPAENAIITNRMLTFTWARSTGASTYELQIDTSSDLTLPPIDVGARTSYRMPTPISNGRYHWRVRAFDRAGNVSAWSAMRPFIVVAGVTLEAEEAAMPSLVEAESKWVEMTGFWVAEDTVAASGESFLISSGRDTDDVLALTFEGSKVTVVFVKDPAFGTLAIEIDGELVQLVACSDVEGRTFDVEIALDGLAAGEHTIRVYPAAGVVGVDAIVVE
ncbi:MAG: choice-of-anchor D domain-containing protein [Anaerolineae bacterium]|nr:choice-of-anchor D domain-containing protein [Anaerolineae bacterium]